MARAWFRHQPNMRYDPAVSILCEEFGPLGDLVWRRLLELHCDDDEGITIRRADLRTALALRPEWEIDLDAWLVRAAQLKLVTVRSRRDNRASSVRGMCTVRARRWTIYNPDYATREAAAERKRRSRGKSESEPESDGHSDVTVTSQAPGRDVRTGLDEQDERTGPRARDPEPKAGVSHESEPEPATPSANGRGMPDDVRQLVDAALAVTKAMP